MIPEVHDLFSQANRRRFAVWTWTPPTPGPHPMLLLLHGVNDSGGHGWWVKGRAHETISRLAAEGVEAPVLVMPTDTGAECGTAYADWVDGTTKAETFIVDELLPWASRTLPVDDRRWVTGLSMGGQGALMLALRHPGLFASASAMSSFFVPARMRSFVPDVAARAWGGPEGQAAHDVSRLVHEPHRRDGLRIAMCCGVDDVMIPDNRELHAALTEAGIAHGYAEHPGGHEWDYWRTHLEDHVRFHAFLPGPLGTS